MRVLLHLLVIIFLTSLAGQAQNRSLSKNDLIQDLHYLELRLRKLHPNLYQYSTATGFSDFFRNLQNQIPDSLTRQQAYPIIASVSSILKDGHTLFFPNPESLEEHNQQSPFFPFRIFIDQGELYIHQNWSNQSELAAGSKLVLVNGKDAHQLLKEMMMFMMRDGDNPNYAIWVLNNFFGEYYSYAFGHPTMFHLTVSDPEGTLQKFSIAGLTRENIRKNRRKRYPEPTEPAAVELQIDPASQSGVLTIKTWHSNILRKRYRQKFKAEIQKIFSQIASQKLQNLIIDLRGNQGGDTRNSRLLLSYLLKEPFELVEQYYKVGNPISLAKDRLVECKGPQMGIHNPQKQIFSGKLLVLIDGGSFSNTGIFCTVLKKQNRAIFIGEESGGSAYVIAGGAKRTILPNSKIVVEIPTLQFRILEEEPEELSGIRPDHAIKPSIQDLLASRDPVREFAFELIESN